MPFGPYASFDECVAKNSDKSSPEGFCAWLHHKITGTWPSGMSADKYPSPWLAAYDTAMTAGKTANEAEKEANAAAQEAGYQLTRFGWVKQFQAPNMKSIAGVRIFGAGTWTDSAGYTREWTTEDLQKIVDAFEAGVPAIVPIKCGHTSDAFNERIAKTLGVPVETVTGDKGQGQISLGKMTSLAIKGSWLIAGFDNVPEPIADLIEGGQYSTVSVEIEDTVGDFGPVITGVALLGAEEPAVQGASLERALVFGGSREGARVYSFSVGDDIPTSTLRAEFDDIWDKLTDLIKGKRGAPIFRALFRNISELFERMTVGRHAAGGELSPEELQKGKPPKDWWDRCVAKVSTWPGVNDVDRFCGSVWFHDDPIPASSFASDEAANQAEVTFKKGVNLMEIKAFKDKKPEDIKKMTVKLQEGEEEVTIGEIVDALPEEPAKGVADIAAALGLGADATVEDIIAAIEALKGGAGEVTPPEEMKKLQDQVTKLQAQVDGQTSLAAWKEKTAELTTIPGTAQEHAEKLADIETKAGKDAAEAQFAALQAANNIAVEATKIVGTSRTGETTDWDNEVTKYQKDHPDENKGQAIKAVAKARPDLYHARRQ